jgi:hypothetical protein
LDVWENLRQFVIAALDQAPRLQKIFIEGESLATVPLGLLKELQENVKSRGVDFIPLILGGERRERGWGMDGSVQWAPCATYLNKGYMPFHSAQNKDIAATDVFGPNDVSNRDPFY